MQSGNWVRSMRPALVLLSVLAVALLSGGLVLSAATGAASTITVSTTSDVLADDGLCSLREAVIAANTDTASGPSPGECPAGSGPDTIEFGAGLPDPAVFLLTLAGANEDFAQSGDLDIRQSVTIDGSGAGTTIIDGNLTDRVLEVHPGGAVLNLVTVNQATLRHGDPGPAAQGGAVLVDATGRLTLNNSEVISSTATSGGGVKVLGLLTLNVSTVSGNQGGGVSNDAGGLLFTNAQVDSNSGGYGIANQSGGFLTFTGGSVSHNQGGGIYNHISNATIDSVEINYNTANINTNGGGIYNIGPATPSSLYKLRLTNSRVMSNTAVSGGGILNTGLGGIAIVEDSQISHNHATVGGGGINNAANLTLSGSTLNHNQSRSGGAIDHSGSSLVLTNNTLSYNTVSDNGGGLYNRSSATFNHVTLNANAAGAPDTGGNIFNEESASLSVHNTIVANAGAGGNCANVGTLTSTGHNLESANTCGFGAAGDLINTDPLLGPLQDNGGPTWTHALSPGSPAIGAADNDGCEAADQRGVPRPQGAVCDIGSYESVLDGEADLSVAKIDAIDPVTVSDSIIYTVTVSNNGPDSASNTSLTDDLPGGVIFVSATPDQGDCGETAGVVTCNLGDLPSGASADVIIEVTTTSPGTLTNSASAASDMVDLNPGNNDASEDTTVNPVPVPEADLSIAKAGSPDPVDAGAVLTYTLVVTNTGPDAASAVTVTDQLPAGVAYGGAWGDGWSCGQAGGTATCTRPSLPVGVAPTIVLTVSAPLNGGTITNSVLVSSATEDGNTGNNTSSEGTTITPPPVEAADLSIAKLDGPDPVKVSTVLTYTLIVTNAGPDAATAITVTDQLPGGTVYGGASGDAWSCSHLAGVVTCTRPSLAVGVAPSIVLTVTAPAISGTITNTVTVSGNEFDPANANNAATAVTQVKFPYRSFLPLILR